MIAKSYERIHRSNLIGMGVLPLQFAPGQNATTLGLSGKETFTIHGLDGASHVSDQVRVTATGAHGNPTEFTVRVRIDTPSEADYYRHGGIMPYMLRRLAAR